MKNIDNIKVEKFYYLDKKFAEIMDIMNQMKEVDKEMPFIETLSVYPYGRKEFFKKYYDKMKDWRLYTSGSRSLMITEMNGCIDIINAMINRYNEPDVSVKMLEGKYAGEIRTFKKSEADALVDCQVAEFI